MPKTWTVVVMFLEGYSPLLNYKVVRWIHPHSWTDKYNTSGSGIDIFALIVWNEEGDFLYTETIVLKHVSVIES